jgi:2-polyprenyl-3-methyl-5-hydroxy-6-metoxy-1,4-benzoquinol methylase
MSLIDKELRISSKSKVVDYGCGIGRLSREIIKKYRCEVTGVDISSSMRELAKGFVNSSRFDVLAPDKLDDTLYRNYDVAIAVWTLQHIPDARKAVRNIADLLRVRNGSLFVVNNKQKAVPVLMNGTFIWGDDGQDVQEILRGECQEVLAEGRLDPRIVSQEVSDVTFYGVYRFSRGRN